MDTNIAFQQEITKKLCDVMLSDRIQVNMAQYNIFLSHI